MRRTFVLGLGAQKAGTSWLHDYLASSPACAPAFRKEMHLWDGLDLPSEAWMRRRVLTRATRALARCERGESRPGDADAVRQAGFYLDPDGYVDYYAGLTRGPAFLTVDMTPSYALLTAARLRDIRDRFAARGLEVVPVFVLRDPVERIWSMVRMNQHRRPADFPGPSWEWVGRLYAHEDHALRTRYEITLAALDEAFGPGRSWVGFYEELFTDDTLGDLCARLGIDFLSPRRDVVINSVPRSDGLPEELVARVARHFSPTYRDVRRRFGAARVDALWPHARQGG